MEGGIGHQIECGDTASDEVEPKRCRSRAAAKEVAGTDKCDCGQVSQHDPAGWSYPILIKGVFQEETNPQYGDGDTGYQQPFLSKLQFDSLCQHRSWCRFCRWHFRRKSLALQEMESLGTAAASLAGVAAGGGSGCVCIRAVWTCVANASNWPWSCASCAPTLADWSRARCRSSCRDCTVKSTVQSSATAGAKHRLRGYRHTA